MADVDHCVICDRSVLRRRHHVLSLGFLESHRDFVEYMFGQHQQEIVFDGSRSLCHPCWQRIDYGLRHPPEPEAPPTETFCVSGLTRAANTSRRCMIDNCNNLELHSVSDTSIHKYTNLIKPFMIVCGDGYIIEVTGPYDARTSDAKILRQILDNHNDHMEDAPIRWFLETDDVMVLDRGFRDALFYAEECGFTVCTPQSLGRHETQLSTEAANKSRLVTLVRWVVETINGRLKRDFKIFRHRYFNNTLSNAIVDFRIAAALINATQESYSDSRLTDSFSEMIERNVNRPNLLADYVDEQRLNAQRNISFQRMEATLDDVSDFPRMTYDELIIFAIGTYHVKLARSYWYEHIRRTSEYSIELYRHPERVTLNDEEENTLLRCRIKSRHVTSKTYYCYVLYNHHAISEYCCNCIHGRRTLGSCAHVISIIYYLAWARYEGDLIQPAGFLDAVCLDLENVD